MVKEFHSRQRTREHLGAGRGSYSQHLLCVLYQSWAFLLIEEALHKSVQGLDAIALQVVMQNCITDEVRPSAGKFGQRVRADPISRDHIRTGSMKIV